MRLFTRFPLLQNYPKLAHHVNTLNISYVFLCCSSWLWRFGSRFPTTALPCPALPGLPCPRALLQISTFWNGQVHVPMGRRKKTISVAEWWVLTGFKKTRQVYIWDLGYGLPSLEDSATSMEIMSVYHSNRFAHFHPVTQNGCENFLGSCSIQNQVRWVGSMICTCFLFAC